MFTPQRKAPWTPANTAPRTEPKTNSRNLHITSAKGKTVSFFDAPPTPPPTSSLGVLDNVGFDGGNSEDWRRFKEVGLLDESALEKKDRQATLDRISRLQNELFDYQYNMGLLLIDKNTLASKTEELGQEVSEAVEILKRERAAHLMAVSEAEKREENLKKALSDQRKSLADLERDLRHMHEEHAKTKATSNDSTVDLNARMEELHKQSLNVKERSHLADAKLAELDRKNSELDRKLQDLEDRESILQREQSSLTHERESHELYFRKQKEDLLKWEKKLEEGEQRLCESRRAINESEEKLHEIDISSKVKESNIEELQIKIDVANATLIKVESDVKNQLADLHIKEKNADAVRDKLEARQKQLQEDEERLHEREKVNLAKILDEHQVTLDGKMQEFELDLKQKRKTIEEELKSRKEAVYHRESDINHLEMKLGKQEQGLEKKTVRLKEIEMDTDMKNKVLKEQQKNLKAEDKSLEAEKKHVNAEKESLEILKQEIEMLRDIARKQELTIEEEQKKMENAEKERSEYLYLQSSLEQEIDNVRLQSEIVVKEMAELKLERGKFEKDWEALDEKRAGVNNELKMLDEEKASFARLRNTEEEKLERESTEIEKRFRLESESIRSQKESSEAMMEHEKFMLDERAKNMHTLMHKDFERQKQDLYNDMQKKREERGKVMEEKERTLEEKILRDTTILKDLKEDAEKKMDEMEIERHRMEKVKEELEMNKKKLEESGSDISKDIEALDHLSKKLKKQRVQLVSEREHFVALIEKTRCCKNCGDSAQAFLTSDLQLPVVEGSSHLSMLSRDVQNNSKDNLAPRNINNSKSPLPKAVDRDPSQLDRQMSVLRKCASVIFNLSPKEGREENPYSATHIQANDHVREQTSVVDELNVRTKTPVTDEPGTDFKKVNDAIKFSQSGFREDNADNLRTIDEFNIDNEVQSIKKPEKSDVKNEQRKSGRRRGPGVQRKNNVKTVVEDAQVILRDDSVRKLEQQPKDLVGADVSNQEIDMMRASSARKRSRSQASRVPESEQDDHSEGNADSVTTISRRKRRQTVASAVPTSGQRRYNLRRHAVAASSGAPENQDESTRKDTDQAVRNPDETPAQSLDIANEGDRRLHMVQVSTTRSVEFSSDRCNETADVADNHVDAAKSVARTLSIKQVKGTEEANETSENFEEDSRSMVNENEDDDDNNNMEEDEDEDEDEEDENDHIGQASIGKKLWKFLTS